MLNKYAGVGKTDMKLFAEINIGSEKNVQKGIDAYLGLNQ
jgi:hypothetical protein